MLNPSNPWEKGKNALKNKEIPCNKKNKEIQQKQGKEDQGRESHRSCALAKRMMPATSDTLPVPDWFRSMMLVVSPKIPRRTLVTLGPFGHIKSSLALEGQRASLADPLPLGDAPEQFPMLPQMIAILIFGE